MTPLIMLALGLVGMLGPFGSDANLPAMPAMSDFFATTYGHVVGALAMYTLGMGAGQLVIGLLSDMWGRKKLLVGGVFLMSFSSLGCALASNLPMLFMFSLTMGLGAAAAIVLGRAVVSDTSQGREATRYFSILQVFVTASPVVGPLGGSLLFALAGWRSIYFAMAAFACVGAIICWIVVPETHPVDRRVQIPVTARIKGYGQVLRLPTFLRFGGVIWLGTAFLFTYLSSSSYVVQDVLGLSTTSYAADFAINGAGILICGFITSAIAKKVRGDSILLFGGLVQIFAMALLAVVLLTNSVSPWTIFPIYFLIPASMGFIFGPSTSLAVQDAGFARGTALALMGSLQFVMAAFSTFAVGLFVGDPLPGMLLVGGIASLASVLLTLSNRRQLKSLSLNSHSVE